MQDTKPWYQSTGIWGSIVSIVAVVLGLFHVVNLTADQQSALVGDLVTVATAMGTIIGVVMALIGRLKATQKIGPKAPK